MIPLFIILGFITIYNIYCSSPVSATSATTTLTVTVSHATASTDLAVNDTTGTFASSNDDSSIKFSVDTNNYTGYTLSLFSTNNTNALLNTNNLTYEDGTIAKFSPIPNDLAKTQFMNSANTIYNNMWGYSLYTGDTAPAEPTYHPAPDGTGALLDTVESATTSPIAYTLGLGVRADYTQPVGAYSNSYALQAVGRAATYSVAYNANGGSNAPNTYSGYADGPVINYTLSSDKPTRTGYSFGGWCSTVTTDSNGSSICPSGSTTYATGSEQPFTIDQTANTTTINLYAIWDINSYTCTKRYRLQNADGNYPTEYTSDGAEQIQYGAACSYSKSVNYYTTQSVSDTMDVDGLTLSLDLPRTTYYLTVNRNATYISSITGAGTYRWGQSVNISATPSSGNKFTTWSQTAGTTSSFGSTSSTSTTFTMPQSAATIYADGASNYTGYYIQDFTKNLCQSLASSSNYTVRDRRDNSDYTVRYINGDCWMTQNLGIIGTVTATDSNFSGNSIVMTNGAPFYSFSDAQYYGSGAQVWYNFCAAAAKTGNSCTSSAEYTSNTDICPANWHLPTKEQFEGVNVYFSPVTGGAWRGKEYNISNDHFGFWWSSTGYGGWYQYYLASDGYSLYVNSYETQYEKNSGFYIRCVRTS